MKSTPYAITEWPGKTLFSRQEAAQIMGIGVSTLDSLIPYSELPRTVIHKRVNVSKGCSGNSKDGCNGERKSA